MELNTLIAERQRTVAGDKFILYPCTRAQAVEAGRLVDITGLAATFQFTLPVAITSNLLTDLGVTKMTSEAADVPAVRTLLWNYAQMAEYVMGTAYAFPSVVIVGTQMLNTMLVLVPDDTGSTAMTLMGEGEYACMFEG